MDLVVARFSDPHRSVQMSNGARDLARDVRESFAVLSVGVIEESLDGDVELGKVVGEG